MERGKGDRAVERRQGEAGGVRVVIRVSCLAHYD